MSFEKKIIHTNQAPLAVGTYSQGVEHNGFYFFSGQIGLDPSTMKLQEGFKKQASQIMKNIDALLGSCQLDRHHIIKTSVFITDFNNFEILNDIYKSYFTKPYPARSCVQVSALPKESLVEIEVTAVNK